MLKEQKYLQAQIRETNSQLRLYEKLFSAVSLEDFLLILHKESCQRFKTQSLVFCRHSGHFGFLQHICHSRGVYKKACSFVPEKRKSLKIKDRADSQYLAGSLGRPVQNILSIPVFLRRCSADQPAYLFLEFVTKTPDRLLEFYDKSFLSLITGCLDRLLLKDHLNTGVELWTAAFNKLNEPLAVLDEEKNLRKANNIFHRIFGSSGKEDLNSGGINKSLFYWKDKTFEKYSYPVNIQGAEYTVQHYADISESLSLRNQMIQNKKMSALGELGEKVAHQLNNPLTGVLSMAKWLLNSEKLPHNARKDMEDIVEGVSRSQEIIANLLDFSRGAGLRKVCELNEVIRKTLPLLKSLMGFSDLQVDFYKEAVPVKAQSGLLRQVVFNLIKNSCQAVEELKDAAPRQVAVRVYKRSGRAILCVEDSGMGIKPEDCKNVFKPFFTTKSKSQGTGLGLSVSKNIVESFQGSLKVSGSSLGGACFTVSLPLSDESGI